MTISSRILCVAVAATAVSAALPAHADLSIAKRATKNVSCSGGACVATSRDAVMNVTDLQNLLASQQAVSLDAGPAKSIAVDASLSWTSNATLSLSAASSLTVNRPVTVAGSGGVTVQTTDGGLSFAPKASLSFWSLSSALTINSVSYTLVGDVKTIANDLNSNLVQAFALARDYDASVDGAYSSAPIPMLIQGDHLEGLGHTISHLRVNGIGEDDGLVGTSFGTLANLNIFSATVMGGYIGLAVGINGGGGLIDHVAVTGTIADQTATTVGGLTADNYGLIRNSSAQVRVKVGGLFYTGGLVAVNRGTISTSWVGGTVHGSGNGGYNEGALVAYNAGTVRNCYSLANTNFYQEHKGDRSHGGLLGETSSYSNSPSKVIASYAAGATAPQVTPDFAGGVVGYDGSSSTFASTYWATDSSRHTPKEGAGNKSDDPDITGLTEAQLKSALPTGFDPDIWGQSPNINNGYPYLLANPPQ